MNFSHPDTLQLQQHPLLSTARRPRVSPSPSSHTRTHTHTHRIILPSPAELHTPSNPRIKSSSIIRSPTHTPRIPSRQQLPWNAAASPLGNQPRRPDLSTRHSTPTAVNGTERPKIGPPFLPSNKPPKAKSLTGLPEPTPHARPVSNTVLARRLDSESPHSIPVEIACKAETSDDSVSMLSISSRGVTRSNRNCSVSDHGEIFPLSAADREEGSVETHWSDSGSDLAAEQRNWTFSKDDDQKSEETIEDDPTQAALKIGARKERKMKDLEITNTALLSVNAGLERTIRRQSARIAFLQKELHRNGITELLGDDFAEFGRVDQALARRNKGKRKKKRKNHDTAEKESARTLNNIERNRRETDLHVADNQPNEKSLSNDAIDPTYEYNFSGSSSGSLGSRSDSSGTLSRTDVALERVCTAVEKLVLEGRRAVDYQTMIGNVDRNT